MPASDSPAILVARYLKANNYTETLKAFLDEAGLPQDAGSASKGDLTIEAVLREKQTYDLSMAFEKVGIDEANRGWGTHAPETPTMLDSLPAPANILHISVNDLSVKSWGPCIITTTTDRRLSIVRAKGPEFELLASYTTLHDSPVLSFEVLARRFLLSSSMSGQLALHDLENDKQLAKRADHSKYIVKATSVSLPDRTWIATAGWDSKVHLYQAPRLQDLDSASDVLKDPVATLVLPTLPEDILFLRHPDTDEPLLLLTRRDSTFLFYYKLPTLSESSGGSRDVELLGKQNLAPHSNAWIAFSPTAVRMCPTDPLLAAVATNALPHMKVIVVRLLIPQEATEADTSAQAVVATPSSLLDPDRDPSRPTAASVAREALALQDKEAAAIILHCTTMAPQTSYSTPLLSWRPDGSGIWVNSDDGVIRGIELSSGKVVKLLKEGHENVRIRSLWSGRVADEEWLVSGGFDKKLVVWREEAQNKS